MISSSPANKFARTEPVLAESFSLPFNFLLADWHTHSLTLSSVVFAFFSFFFFFWKVESRRCASESLLSLLFSAHIVVLAPSFSKLESAS